MSAAKHTEWEPVAEAVMASFQPHAETLSRKFAERLYEDFLGSVQDYLTDNVTFNIGQRIAAADRGRREQWGRANTAEARVAELLEAARKADAVLRTMYPTVISDRDAAKVREAFDGLSAAIAKATGEARS